VTKTSTKNALKLKLSSQRPKVTSHKRTRQSCPFVCVLPLHRNRTSPNNSSTYTGLLNKSKQSGV